jgi:hypothetical protein
MLLRDDHARPFHYRFAHRLLSTLLLNPRYRLRDMGADGFATEFLHFVWSDYEQHFPAEERLSPDGLAGTLERAGTVEVLLVTMPPAEHKAEAHFVAVVPCEPPEERRFLTLEHSWTLADEPATMLGAWDKGSHLNLGPGPEPTAAAYLAWIGERFGT